MHHVNRAVKWAKQVLRDQRQNLILWDAYARIERQRGKVDDARAVYVTALSMYRSFAVEEQIDGPLLWHSWAEMEWEEGRAMLALKVWVASVSASEEIDLGKYLFQFFSSFLLSPVPISDHQLGRRYSDPCESEWRRTTDSFRDPPRATVVHRLTRIRLPAEPPTFHPTT